MLAGHSIRSPPLDQANRLESVLIHTPSHFVADRSAFDITFRIHGQEEEFKLALERNKDLLAHSPQIQYLDTTGLVRRTESFGGEEDKVFKGAVWARSAHQGWKKVGWTRVYMLRDGEEPLLEGTFSVLTRHYEVRVLPASAESTDISASEARMAVYHSSRTDLRRDAVELTNPSRCAADQLIPEYLTGLMGNGEHASHGAFALESRQLTQDPGDLINSIGSTAGCPTSKRVALVGIAADCTYTASFGTTEDLRRSLITMVNTASEVFERNFNISLALHNLTLSDANCPSSASNSVPWNIGCSGGDMNWRLQQFSSWRSSLGDSQNAYWTLMTGCPSGSQVGISWMGQLCNSRSGANVVARTSNQWQVFAHESGHTFGAVHDCERSTCPSSQCCPLSSSTCDADAQYIMNPYSVSSQTEFSPCTVGNICSRLGSRNTRTSCLLSDTSNIPTITAAVAMGQPVDSELVLYAMTRQDLAAPTANLHHPTSTCPTDRYAPDGQTCGNSSGLFCANGECTNRDIQCQALLGTNRTGVSSCNSDTCTLSCSVDWNGSGVCMTMNRAVQDGTPCGDGLCQSGRCRGESGNSSSSWVDQHRALVIGLSAGIGGALVLAVVVGIIFRCCCRRQKPGATKVSPPPYSPPRANYRYG
ncbi:Metallo-peptidase family M12-domain-containing protein [Aspergillus coremiiformis]|uniref:Metallo-peptidase family M12-domain-containing protein n=1 Tax=Aspergillus coremiiformis TaxID=138285 RepID=A0A5N6ZFB0_9EURO|nr:Metallo-peptidase family M12-domain-containing protein [Aspergillus coremiiformis]